MHSLPLPAVAPTSPRSQAAALDLDPSAESEASAGRNAQRQEFADIFGDTDARKGGTPTHAEPLEGQLDSAAVDESLTEETPAEKAVTLKEGATSSVRQGPINGSDFDIALRSADLPPQHREMVQTPDRQHLITAETRALDTPANSPPAGVPEHAQQAVLYRAIGRDDLPTNATAYSTARQDRAKALPAEPMPRPSAAAGESLVSHTSISLPPLPEKAVFQGDGSALFQHPKTAERPREAAQERVKTPTTPELFVRETQQIQPRDGTPRASQGSLADPLPATPDVPNRQDPKSLAAQIFDEGVLSQPAQAKHMLPQAQPKGPQANPSALPAIPHSRTSLSRPILLAENSPAAASSAPIPAMPENTPATAKTSAKVIAAAPVGSADQVNLDAALPTAKAPAAPRVQSDLYNQSNAMPLQKPNQDAVQTGSLTPTQQQMDPRAKAPSVTLTAPAPEPVSPTVQNAQGKGLTDFLPIFATPMAAETGRSEWGRSHGPKDWFLKPSTTATLLLSTVQTSHSSPTAPKFIQPALTNHPGAVEATPDLQLFPSEPQVAHNWETTASQTQPIAARARASLPPQVAGQIFDAVRQTPNRPVDIALSPEELGKVRLSVATNDTGIVVNVLAERPETLDLLRRNIDQLGEAFQELGFADIAFSFAGGEQASTGSEQRDGSTGQTAAGPLVELSELGNSASLPPLAAGPLAGLDLRL